jgi:hypothetical protein
LVKLRHFISIENEVPFFYAVPGQHVLMSIALSVMIIPSRILAICVSVMCVVSCGSACYAAVRAGLGSLTLAAFVVIVCAVGMYALLAFFRGRRRFRLEISGAGEMVLRSPQLASCAADGVVRLDRRTSLRSVCLLLHLRTENGALVILPVLRDSVSADDFRRLAVALHWLAMHESDEIDLTDGASGNF